WPDLGPAATPHRYHAKLRIISQSAAPLARRPPLRRCFEILVIGNLRAEKDPLRAAAASRLLPDSSRIRIMHLGGAHDDSWATRARAEMADNPRYVWRGEVAHGVARRAYARAPRLWLGSLMGGA